MRVSVTFVLTAMLAIKGSGVFAVPVGSEDMSLVERDVSDAASAPKPLGGLRPLRDAPPSPRPLAPAVKKGPVPASLKLDGAPAKSAPGLSPKTAVSPLSPKTAISPLSPKPLSPLSPSKPISPAKFPARKFNSNRPTRLDEAPRRRPFREGGARRAGSLGRSPRSARGAGGLGRPPRSASLRRPGQFNKQPRYPTRRASFREGRRPQRRPDGLRRPSRRFDGSRRPQRSLSGARRPLRRLDGARRPQSPIGGGFRRPEGRLEGARRPLRRADGFGPRTPRPSSPRFERQSSPRLGGARQRPNRLPRQPVEAAEVAAERQ